MTVVHATRKANRAMTHGVITVCDIQWRNSQHMSTLRPVPPSILTLPSEPSYQLLLSPLRPYLDKSCAHSSKCGRKKKQKQNTTQNVHGNSPPSPSPHPPLLQYYRQTGSQAGRRGQNVDTHHSPVPSPTAQAPTRRGRNVRTPVINRLPYRHKHRMRMFISYRAIILDASILFGKSCSSSSSRVTARSSCSRQWSTG